MKTHLLLATLSFAACGPPMPEEQVCLSVETLELPNRVQAGRCVDGAITYRGTCSFGSTVRIGDGAPVDCVDGRWSIRAGFGTGRDGYVRVDLIAERDGLSASVSVNTICPTSRDAQPGPSFGACSP